MAATTTKMKAGGVVCDEKCGCPSPCPGGTACQCTGVMATRPRGEEAASTCGGCGKHCGCTGKASCTCGSGCSCTACAA